MVHTSFGSLLLISCISSHDHGKNHDHDTFFPWSWYFRQIKFLINGRTISPFGSIRFRKCRFCSIGVNLPFLDINSYKTEDFFMKNCLWWVCYLATTKWVCYLGYSVPSVPLLWFWLATSFGGESAELLNVRARRLTQFKRKLWDDLPESGYPTCKPIIWKRNSI